jgi:hypothetical protein
MFLASCLEQKSRANARVSSPPLATIPVVHLSANLILLVTVPLLDFALELIATAIDHIEVVVRELPPLFLDVAFHLLPVSFNSVPIHRFLLLSCSQNALGGPAFQLGDTASQHRGEAPKRGLLPRSPAGACAPVAVADDLSG